MGEVCTHAGETTAAELMRCYGISERTAGRWIAANKPLPDFSCVGHDGRRRFYKRVTQGHDAAKRCIREIRTGVNRLERHADELDAAMLADVQALAARLDRLAKVGQSKTCQAES